MTTSKTIKRRIKSAKNIAQITKAMEMVAAAKMRRSQEKALGSRPYADKLLAVLSQLSGQIDPSLHPFLHHQKGSANTIALIIISTNRGLCGSLNTNLFRSLEEFKDKISTQYPLTPLNFEYITIGKKAREFVLKTGQQLHAEFSDFPETPFYQDTIPITKLAIGSFETGKFKEVYLVYMDFISTLKQVAKVQQLLPITSQELSQAPVKTDKLESTPFSVQYLFEPDAPQVLNWLLPYYLETTVYQKILEARASEHSARMITMRNASDNAQDIVKELDLIYNRQRQQSITNEIADIVTSSMALAKKG